MRNSHYWKRIVSFLITIVMILTAIDWGGLGTVTLAAESNQVPAGIHYYNPNLTDEELDLYYSTDDGTTFTKSAVTLKPQGGGNVGWYFAEGSGIEEQSLSDWFVLQLKSTDGTWKSDNFKITQNDTDAVYCMDEGDSGDSNGLICTTKEDARAWYSDAATVSEIYCYSTQDCTNYYLSDGIFDSDSDELDYIWDGLSRENAVSAAENLNVDSVAYQKLILTGIDANQKGLIIGFGSKDWSWSSGNIAVNQSPVYVNLDTKTVYTSEQDFLEAAGLLKEPEVPDTTTAFSYYNPYVTDSDTSTAQNDVYLHYSTDGGVTYSNSVKMENKSQLNDGWYYVSVDIDADTVKFYFSGLAEEGHTPEYELKTWLSDYFTADIRESNAVYCMDTMAMGDGESDRVYDTETEARENFYAGTSEIYVYSNRNITGQYVSDGIWDRGRKDGEGELSFLDDEITRTDAGNGALYQLNVNGVDANQKALIIGFGIDNWTTDTGTILVDRSPAYIDADTGVVYGSEEELLAGQTSEVKIKSEKTVNSVTVTYGTNLTYGNLQAKTETFSVTKEGDWYVAVIPTDAASTYYDAENKSGSKGYQLSYNYDGTDRTVTAPDGLVYDPCYIDGDTASIYDKVVAHYYNSTGWSEVYADVYAGGLEDSDRVISFQACINEGDNWYSIDTGLNPSDYPDGVYVVFKSGAAQNYETGKAYQFENSKRVYVLPNMSMFKSREAAINSLNEVTEENPVEDGYIRVWFYHPGGWKGYNVGYPGTDGEYDYSGLTGSKEYPGWYSAIVPDAAKTIYFDEDQIWNNGGNQTEVYDISTNVTDTIFAAVNKAVLSEGWSISSAGIMEYYGLNTSPASSSISLPVTFLDYSADNLFFEYDMEYLRNMSMVLGTNYNLYNQIGTTTFGRSQPVDRDGARPGNEVSFDRNKNTYVTGIVDQKLSANGYPVYTRQAVEYVAEAAYRAIEFNTANPDKLYYNRTALYDKLQAQLTANGLTFGNYEESKAKIDGNSQFTFDDIVTCTDYAYFIMSSLFNPGSTSNQDYGMYGELILQKTGNGIYGFYNNYSTDQNTGAGLRQNYDVIYDPYQFDAEGNIVGGSGTIRNNLSSDEKNFEKDGYEGYDGFFPLHKDMIDKSYGNGTLVGTEEGQSGQTNTYHYYAYNGISGQVEFTDNAYLDSNQNGTWDQDEAAAEGNAEYNNRNYHYGMKSSGKFRYVDSEDLYFTFTGDDDVFLYIDNTLVMELGGAHSAVSYTVYISDLVDAGILNLVDGRYYDFDFFYMERHTTWSNIRIETNIDVIDVAGSVVKRCYDMEGNLIPSGSTVTVGTEVAYAFELTASDSEELSNLTFSDEKLGVYLSKDIIELNGRDIRDLTVQVGTAVYHDLDEETLKNLLETGIPAEGSIIISGIKQTLNHNMVGPVRTTMYNADADVTLTSHYPHSIYVDIAEIEVTKTAYDRHGTQLPDGSVLHTGELASYTIALTNTGGSAVTDLELVDEKLESAFYSSPVEDQNGETHYFKLNKYTDYSDLVITVNGTGFTDGNFTVTSAEELDTLLERLMNLAYPTGASITISGIQYPVDEPIEESTVVGDASHISDYKQPEDKGLEAYAQEYKKAKDQEKAGQQVTLPTLSDYITIPAEKAEQINQYVEQYIAYIMDETGTVLLPDINKAFTVEPGLTDDATVVLAAQDNEYVYFSEAGKNITPQLNVQETVSVTEPQGTVTTRTETYTQGYHTITVLNETAAITGVVLKNADGNPVTGTVTKAGNGYVTYSVLIEEAGDYTFDISYANCTSEQITVIVDNQPDDYKIVNEKGQEIESKDGIYTFENPANEEGENTYASINNDGLYPVIDYTSDTVASYSFYILPTDAPVNEDGTSDVKPEKVTVHTYGLNNDLYVLDYGLKVDLSNTAEKNGMFANDSVEIRGVDTEATYFGLRKEAGEAGSYEADGFAHELSVKTEESPEGVMTYGRVSSTTDKAADNYAGAKVTYELNKFLSGIETFSYGVQVSAKNASVKNVTSATPVMTAQVKIMPATIVYYEDNFSSVLTNASQDNRVTGGAGASEEQGNGLTTQYGYDKAYADDIAYSNGSYTMLQGTEKFAFEFTGSAFDIVTRTSDASLRVTVYDAEAVMLKSYTYEQKGITKHMIAAVKRPDAPDGVRTVPLKTALICAYYENDTVNQIPQISMDMEQYGHYVVVAQYIGSSESEGMYIDGIRIYNPLGFDTDEKKEADESGYAYAEGESNAQVREIRSMIFGEDYTFDYANPEDPTVIAGENAVAGLIKITDNQLCLMQGSTVVECFTGHYTSKEIAEKRAENPAGTSNLFGYALNGPNNELYLSGEENIFAVAVTDLKKDSMLQIGMKTVEGTPNVQYQKSDGEWASLEDASSLNTSAEMYYKIPLDQLWKYNSENGTAVLLIRVANSENQSTGTVSLTNLKYSSLDFVKFTADELTDILGEDVVVTAADQNTNSFNLISTGATKSKAVVTFSVASDVTNFTVTRKSGDVSEILFTYGIGEELPQGISVSVRHGNGVDVYVIKMPNTLTGHYIITTQSDTGYGQAEFDIE